MNQDIDPNDDVFGLFTSTTPATALRPCNSALPSNSDRLFLDSSSEDDDDGCGGGGEHHLLQYQNDAASVESASERIDHMLRFLDRQLSAAGEGDEYGGDGGESPSRPLPEYVGKGGGSGIFRVPARAAVHPGRPVSLEVRPHPLREAQVGRFLRAIVAAPAAGQLWAAAECGTRVWRLGELYSAGDDEDGAVPFRESAPTPATICAAADELAARVVWSGHRDGRIRCWGMDRCSGDGFREVLSWQAHRGPVLSLVISANGDLWSGSEGGGVKIWPWEAIERALSLTAEERPMAMLTVERSFIDPRSQVAVNGFGNALNSDVKFLLSDNTRGKVWSAGHLSFALWDARSRELLKVFNIDGQLENRVDISLAQDVSVDHVSGSKKDKAQNSVGFFQRSRNAIMGAADVVRRVAAKGSFGDDNRRTEALAITVDGTVWSGCANGLLVQWDGNGNRIQDFHYHSSAVQCLCSFGTRIWVGYLSGYVQVLDLEGKVLGGWVAHSSPVIDMTAGVGYIFTLANHGGIRGWNVSSLGHLDNIVRSELAAKEFLYTKIETLKILTGTWNVGQGRASHDSLISWLGSVTSDVSIVVVGLQEVEMGAGFLAVSAAKETVGLEGSSVGQWWLDIIGKILDEGSTFVRVGSRQLAGLLIAAWVRNDVKAYVGDVDAAAVPCGFGRAIGNKGAVGLRLRVYDRIICFVNCHFAAHLEAVNRRNADFDHVYRTMTFSRPTNLFSAAAVGASSAAHMLRSTNIGVAYSSEGMPELSEADMVVFLGDFNYRLDGISYDEARDFVSQRCFDWLKERDQLRAEMEAGNVFQGMREAVITFPPTYKFERHQIGLAGYDSGEKKRIPAWCDRILYRDSRSNTVSECCLDCPVVSSVLQYEACMDVTDSDHKPVRSIFTVDIARVDESVRRQELGRILGSNKRVNRILEDLCKIPETIISTNNIILQNQDSSILRITNKSSTDDALFEIVSQGQTTVQDDGLAAEHCPRGCFGFPQWLEVIPATGIIRPDDTAEVSVHHDDFQTLEEFVDGVPLNSWCEDFRDKEVILLVKVSGRYTTESRKHRVRVRHCFSERQNPDGREAAESRQIQETLLHRSDLQRLSSSHDVVDHLKTVADNLKDLRSP